MRDELRNTNDEVVECRKSLSLTINRYNVTITMTMTPNDDTSMSFSSHKQEGSATGGGTSAGGTTEGTPGGNSAGGADRKKHLVPATGANTPDQSNVCRIFATRVHAHLEMDADSNTAPQTKDSTQTRIRHNCLTSHQRIQEEAIRRRQTKHS